MTSTAGFALTESTPLAIFTAQVEAFNAHDLDAFLATYSAEADVISSAGSTLSGRDAMREHYARRLATPGLRCDVLSTAPMGIRWLVAHELVGDDLTCTEVIATFEMVDGVIRRSMLMIGDTRPRDDAP